MLRKLENKIFLFTEIKLVGSSSEYFNKRTREHQLMKHTSLAPAVEGPPQSQKEPQQDVRKSVSYQGHPNEEQLECLVLCSHLVMVNPVCQMKLKID